MLQKAYDPLDLLEVQVVSEFNVLLPLLRQGIDIVSHLIHFHFIYL
jgi:hypothetical protein